MLTAIFAAILLVNSLFIYGLYREVKGFGRWLDLLNDHAITHSVWHDDRGDYTKEKP